MIKKKQNKTMYTLQVQLLQHTPLLNFQGDYVGDGATLRATELKPKLDRYISANYSVKPEWKIGKTNALNYKLKILEGEGDIASCSSLPMYFAEQKKKPTDSDFSKKPTMVNLKKVQGSKDIFHYSIIIEIFCLNQQLSEVLLHLDYTSFFLTTNFGTRQSKGYGSFFPIVKVNPENIVGNIIKTERNISYRVDSYFSPVIDDESKVSWMEIMDYINDVYKCLRSGINEDGLYFKSLMFAYAKSKNEWWDKRIIKELFFSDTLQEQQTKHPNRKEPDPLASDSNTISKELYPMFRDNLGLAITEDWREYSINITKKGSNSVARFKSPILFKPICLDGKWFVFLLHREIPQQFKNATFNVKVDNIIWEGNRKITENIGIIKTKTYVSFSMDDYMDYVWNIDNYEQYVEAFNEEAKNRRDGILNDLDEINMNYFKKGNK